jgi:peptidyl-prolyl cis-trans isomerase B (cyclophilin B)
VGAVFVLLRRTLEFDNRILKLSDMIKSRLSVLCLALPILFLAACRTTETVPEAVEPSAAVVVEAPAKVAIPAMVEPAKVAIPAVVEPSAAVVAEAPAKAVAPEAPAKAAPAVVAPVPARVKDVAIVMHTSKGDIEATLFATKTPVTVANFLNLAKRGYYDGLTFHRVIPNFMIQGGDPTGTGRGGPGYQFEDEIHPALRHTRGGLFSMANAGRGTNGSQFFVTHNATPWLDGKHTVFGKVTKGQKVVDAIQQGATINSIDVLDSTDALFIEQKQRITQWNTALSAQGL